MQQFNQLSDWLSYFEKSPRFAMQLGLERISTVAKSLNLLLPNIPIITVAGTNGKGSTVQALKSIYSAYSYRVGTYTSPHLFRFNERIAINEQTISDDDICAIFTKIESVRREVPLTYFETTTLAAMYYFCHQQVDIIILEVGMGGRLDATNLWDADLAIITTIDYDHEAYLGNTLESIGGEKAGILRANQIAIFAGNNPPSTIVEKAKELGTEIYYFDNDYQIVCQDQDNFLINFRDKSWSIKKPQLQINAIASALVAEYLLQSNAKSRKRHWHIFNAINRLHDSQLFQTALIGRRQIVYGKINLLFDVSHNPQSVALLREIILKQQQRGKVYAVFSALKDKNIFKMIDLLTDVVDVWYSAVLNVSRAANLLELHTAFTEIKNIHFESSIEIAFKNAYSRADEGDWIIIFGSFYVVSALMKKEHYV